MSNYALFLDAVNVRRGNKKLLRNVSFSLAQGEIGVLMGLNGAGKSTLLKTIVGLIPEGSGTLKIQGICSTFPKARKGISYLPEKFSAHPKLTGFDYLSLRSSEFYQGWEDLLKTFNFTKDNLNGRLETYSKGMMQKLGLVVFFALQASLKIGDEIMSGLDFKTRPLVRNFLQDQKRGGTTFLFSTHLWEDCQEGIDTLLFLQEGTLTYKGVPKLFLEFPK